MRIKHNHGTLHAIKCTLRLLLFSTFYCMSRLLKNFNAYSISRLSIGSLFSLCKLEKRRAKQALRGERGVWASSCPTPSPSAITHTHFVLHSINIPVNGGLRINESQVKKPISFLVVFKLLKFKTPLMLKVVTLFYCFKGSLT